MEERGEEERGGVTALAEVLKENLPSGGLVVFSGDDIGSELFLSYFFLFFLPKNLVFSLFHPPGK